MELLSNLVWLAVAISLWGFWLVHRRSVRKGSLFHAVGVQVIALAMLTTILLPAISITDDLHASQFPAEIKRSVLQGDQHHNPAAPPSILPVALALLAFCMRPSRPRIVTFLSAETAVSCRQVAAGRALWSRPPPSA